LTQTAPPARPSLGGRRVAFMLVLALLVLAAIAAALTHS